jgi:hypothetical protein
MRSRVPTSEIKKRDEARMITLEAPKDYAKYARGTRIRTRRARGRQLGQWEVRETTTDPYRISALAVGSRARR